MSLILDALKKLDREKAFIRKVTANIADEILKTDPRRSDKKFWLHFAAVAFTALAAAAITYGVVTEFDFLSKNAPSNAAKLNQRAQSAPMPLEPVKETRKKSAAYLQKPRMIRKEKNLPSLIPSRSLPPRPQNR